MSKRLYLFRRDEGAAIFYANSLISTHYARKMHIAPVFKVFFSFFSLFFRLHFHPRNLFEYVFFGQHQTGSQSTVLECGVTFRIAFQE